MYLHPILQQTLQTHGNPVDVPQLTDQVFAWWLAVWANVWVTQAMGVTERLSSCIDRYQNSRENLQKDAATFYLDDILSLRDRFHLVERWFEDVLMKK